MQGRLIIVFVSLTIPAAALAPIAEAGGWGG